ncbi:MAG: hypothetical protein F6K19_51250 [Cyanothece sp. SIO1E1]|nr:hypothetical protein [Cyanothece sp. SIO1E1]
MPISSLMIYCDRTPSLRNRVELISLLILDYGWSYYREKFATARRAIAQSTARKAIAIIDYKKGDR